MSWWSRFTDTAGKAARSRGTAILRTGVAVGVTLAPVNSPARTDPLATDPKASAPAPPPTMNTDPRKPFHDIGKGLYEAKRNKEKVSKSPVRRPPAAVGPPHQRAPRPKQDSRQPNPNPKAPKRNHFGPYQSSARAARRRATQEGRQAMRNNHPAPKHQGRYTAPTRRAGNASKTPSVNPSKVAKDSTAPKTPVANRAPSKDTTTANRSANQQQGQRQQPQGQQQGQRQQPQGQQQGQATPPPRNFSTAQSKDNSGKSPTSK